MKRRVTALAAVVLAVISWSADVFAEILTFRDKLGRDVSVQLPIRRAVLFETYELTAALGVWDRIVGISRYAYENDLVLALKPDIAKTVPSAGSGFDVNIESLLRLRPDLVITWSFKPESIRFMEERGLKVIGLYPESLFELYEAMRVQGRLFGKEKKVEAYIARMKKMFAMVSERCRAVPPAKRKKVVWLGGKQTTVSGGVGINNDLIALMNAINPAAAQQERSADVSMERIVAWNPEIVFIWGSAKYGSEDLLGSPQWRHIDAIRNRRVYKAPRWGTWSPRLAVVALWMAMRTYPEQFRDVNFEKAADDFIRAVYGISYRSINRINE
ncbi:MAG: ABC transporter substrate-binding protein [Syntrophales bacterium]